ncbi:Gfo/Idh/MocA family oxidoreductase [Bacteroides caecigallinarum]|uniref:Gfo/Idh/MocA family protein n=1 Tax=Bacteroides caecigallinarum TaxID=1411144 RepID=UPI001F3DDB30|nr:Gfo/Idh/MocA family oxidoreductase [Bacteroides caecigallinarum]MCF2594021.1 Gfo/Idh/MocA family oxidoreductase [Bacteroides caecigallinarum]
MKKYKIGIIGCGHIAEKMAATINGMHEAESYAVASRSIEKAQAFASKWNFSKAYGSYEELVADSEIDLVYIATPHSHHYEHARLCIMNGKPVLCEKSFTANARQAEELIRLAEEKNVFITEAIWTRYMPLSVKMKELLDEGVIGTPYSLYASLGYVLDKVERVLKPELAGGALLDIGVYTLNFAAMAFGSEVADMKSVCKLLPTGTDAQESISLIYKDGKIASLLSTVNAQTDRMGIISGDKGRIIVENINCPESIKVYDTDYKLIAEYKAPEQITGFEYQVRASIEAIENGWKESPYMPHKETIRIMHQMDALRKEWGVKYPWD